MTIWILLSLLLVVPLVIGFGYMRHERHWRYGLSGSDFWSAWGISMIVGVLVTGLTVGGLATALSQDSSATKTYTQVDSRSKLAALGNKTSSTSSWGVFLLFGGGSSTNSQRISYVSTASDGGYKLHTIKATHAETFEDATPGTATLVVKQGYASNPWLLPFPVKTDSEYAFHVPKGTIERSYSIDVNN